MSRAGCIAVVCVLVGCKGKTPEKVVGPTDGYVPQVDQELQIVAVEPRNIAANSATTVRVIGAGFSGGSALLVGNARVTSTTFVDANTLSVLLPPMAMGSYDVTVEAPDGRKAMLRQGLIVSGQLVDVESCRHVTIYFDTDDSSVSAEARAILGQHVPCYSSIALPLTVEGHADARGTTDYNLALGQRRAEAVRLHLSNSGVTPSRINAVSLGEERPVARGEGESAWSKNRRAEILVD